MSLPTNISDAVSAIKDGEIGFLDQVKIGDIIVSSLTSLDGSDEHILTERILENGFKMIDAAIEVPTQRTLTICFTNPDYSASAGIEAALTGDVQNLTQTWREKKDRLYEYKKNLELVTLQTQESIYENMFIIAIAPIFDVNENYDAFFASVTLNQIKTNDDVKYGIFDQPIENLGSL